MTKNFVLSENKGQIYTFYPNPLDKEANYATTDENATDVFTSAGVTDNTQNNSAAKKKGTVSVGGSSYIFTHYPRGSRNHTIVVPDAVENATLHMVLQGYNNTDTPNLTSLTLSKDGEVVDSSKTIAKNTVDVIEYSNLSGGTYTLTCDYSVYYHLLILETTPTHTVSGVVTNSEGEPIKCATITTSVGLKTRTDGDGKYSIAIPEGSSSIKVTAFGYSDAGENFTTDEDITRDFTLRKNRGEVYKFYGNTLDAEADYDSTDNNATDVFTNFKVSTSTSSVKGGPFEVNGSTYNLKHYGGSSSSLTIKVPEGVADASLYMVIRGNGNSDTKLTLSKDGGVIDNTNTLTAYTANIVTFTDLSEGTYTLTCDYSVNVMLAMLATSPVYTISGTVTNTEGAIVKCATVYIDDKEVITDGNGRYSIDISDGKLIDNIRVTALGCKDYEESVSIDEETTKDIILHKNRYDVYTFFGNEKDAITNYDSIANNAKDIFKDAVTYTSRFTERIFNIDGSTYKCTYSGRARSRYTIVVPEGVTAAELYMAVTSNYSSAIQFTLSKDGAVVDDQYTLDPTSSDVVTYKNLREGTYTLTTTASVYPSLLVLTTSPVYSLSGTVMDNAGTPIKCATIELDTGFTLRTDGEGKYSIDIAEETTINNIKVTAMGYEDSEEAVSINGDTTQDIVLNKESDTYKFFANETDATANYETTNNNSTNVFTNAIMGSSKVTGTNTYSVGGSFYKMNYISGNVSTLNIVVPKNYTNAKLYVVGKSYRTNYTTSLTLSKNGKVVDNQQTLPGSKMSIITYEDLDEGTYTLKGNYAYRYTLLALTAEEKEIVESTTETTTEGSFNVRVNRGDNSTAESINVSVKKNGEVLEDVTSLNIGSNTEIGKLKRNDVLTFTFDEETAKKITNWSGFKSTLNDKTYTLTYKVTSTSSVPVMYYYDEMSTVNLGRTSAIAASYGGYGFGKYDAMIAGRNLKSYTVIKGHRYSLYDVGDGIYDKDGTEYGVANETVLLLGDSDDKVVVKNNIDSSTKALVILDCSKEDAVVTAVDGALYSSYDGTNATEVDSVVGKTEDRKKLQFYIDGGTTLNIKGTDTDNYSVLRSVRIFDVNNVTTGVTAIDNGLASDLVEDSSFASIVASLDATDRLFTVVGMVNGDYRDTDFMRQINKVGFVLYDADVVDNLGEEAKNMNPQQLQINYSGTDFGEETIQTNSVYKNFYDVNQYDETLDADKSYTGATSQEEGNDKSYFAYVVSVSQGKRYYAYPFTMYTNATEKSYAATSDDRIEISN